MAPRKSTAAKAKKAVASAAAPKTARKKTAKRKTARAAAHAHSAAVSRHAPRRSHDYHTYTDHRSDSYKHYASIMKTIILFLGFVLLLAILANLFSPSINSRTATATHTSSRNFLDTRESGYRGYASGDNKPYRYAVPEGAASSSSSGSAPAPEAPAKPGQ